MQSLKIAGIDFLMQDSDAEVHSEHIKNYGTLTRYQVPIAISIGGDYWVGVYSGSAKEYREGQEPLLKDVVRCLVDDLVSAIFGPDEFYQMITRGTPDRDELRTSLDFLDFAEAHDNEIGEMIMAISGDASYLDTDRLEAYLENL